jgi:hypothetical protein
MASVTIPKPGTRLGPCLEYCQHKDCADHRKSAGALCVFCRKPIGYNVPMAYHALDGAEAHWACIEENQERMDAKSLAEGGK